MTFCSQGGKGSLYDVTSCLAAWSHFPFEGSLFLVPYSFWGSCLWYDVPSGGPLDRDPLLDRDPPGQRPLDTPSRQRPSCTVKSGRYASYWNAFLLNRMFTSSNNTLLVQIRAPFHWTIEHDVSTTGAKGHDFKWVHRSKYGRQASWKIDFNSLFVKYLFTIWSYILDKIR